MLWKILVGIIVSLLIFIGIGLWKNNSLEKEIESLENKNTTLNSANVVLIKKLYLLGAQLENNDKIINALYHETEAAKNELQNFINAVDRGDVGLSIDANCEDRIYLPNDNSSTSTSTKTAQLGEQAKQAYFDLRDSIVEWDKWANSVIIYLAGLNNYCEKGA